AVYNIASAWDTVTTIIISNCWKKMGIMNTNDMTAATHFVKTNIQDKELQLNLALNILEPLVNYEILNPQEYIDIPVENEAIHHMLSIKKIVNTISQSDDTDNSDNDGLEFSKILISLALSSIHNISLFLQQEDPFLST
ncbi:5245_t:CDS:1, partial [Ambispora leptoticha]